MLTPNAFSNRSAISPERSEFPFSRLESAGRDTPSIRAPAGPQEYLVVQQLTDSKRLKRSIRLINTDSPPADRWLRSVPTGGTRPCLAPRLPQLFEKGHVIHDAQAMQAAALSHVLMLEIAVSRAQHICLARDRQL